MSAERTTRGSSWWAQVALGLYAGLGAVALSAFVYQAFLFADAGGRLTWLTSPRPFRLVVQLHNHAPVILLVIGTVFAGAWLARAGHTGLPSRLAAATLSVGPYAWLTAVLLWRETGSRSLVPRAEMLIAVLLCFAGLLMLPIPRAWRVPRRARVSRALLVLPAVVMALLAAQAGFAWLRMTCWRTYLHAIEIPVPTGAEEVMETYRGSRREVRFTMRVPYKSTAVADFYADYFRIHAWAGPYYVFGWGPHSCRAVVPRGHPVIEYRSTWVSPAGGVADFLLVLWYPATQGFFAEDVLALERLRPEVQQVTVSLVPNHPWDWPPPYGGSR